MQFIKSTECISYHKAESLSQFLVEAIISVPIVVSNKNLGRSAKKRSRGSFVDSISIKYYFNEANHESTSQQPINVVKTIEKKSAMNESCQKTVLFHIAVQLPTDDSFGEWIDVIKVTIYARKGSPSYYLVPHSDCLENSSTTGMYVYEGGSLRQVTFIIFFSFTIQYN